MMGRTMMATLAVALMLPATAIATEKGSWLCKGTMDQDDEELAARGGNIGMQRVMQEYRERWDAAHIRQQCEAFAKGEPNDIRCLNGRRDWNSIQDMVPTELFGMSNGEIRPHYLELQEADDGLKSALSYCREIGAIE